MLLVASANVHSSNPRADAAMDRYASGDDTAFAELYDALAPRMYTFILRKVGNVARAEDLVQQTLLKLHCARGRYVAGSCVSPWAFAILRRLHLDQERRKKLEVLSPDGSDDDDVTSPRSNPEESAARREQLEILVASVLSQLSPPQQAAFELVHYGQMSHAEAAEALGTTVASVKLRVQRAYRTLRSTLESANAVGANGNPNA
jgi:RNA polymerase sigma-70 factor (ECF subfamily)